jgi:hypothetical protein
MSDRKKHGIDWWEKRLFKWLVIDFYLIISDHDFNLDSKVNYLPCSVEWSSTLVLSKLVPSGCDLRLRIKFDAVDQLLMMKIAITF